MSAVNAQYAEKTEMAVVYPVSHNGNFMGYQKVLLPVSGKHKLQRAMLALEQALQVVRKDGEICIFHCMDDVQHCLSRQQALPLLQRMQEAGVKCMMHIMEGYAAIQIPRFAEENKYEVIIMFAGERNELGKPTGKLVMGGITERVFHATSIPLLLVRA